VGVLFLVGAGYYADRIGRPFLVAMLFAVASGIIGLIEKEPFFELLITGILTFIVCATYFSILVRYSGQLLIWFITLLGFPVLLFALPIIMR